MSGCCRRWRVVLAVFAMAMLGGCGGGDDGGSSSSLPPLEGLWQGSFTSSTNLGGTIGAGPSEAVAIVFDGGQLIMVDDRDNVYQGAYNAEGSTGFTAATVRRFAAMTSGGRITPDLRLTGNIRRDNSTASGFLLVVNITTVGGTGDTDELQLELDEDYEEDSDLSLISDTWRLPLQGQVLTLTVQEATGIIGGQVGVCFYTNGTIDTPDPQRNLYDVTLTLTGIPCTPPAGTYNGYATLEDSPARLRIFATSGNGALHLVMTRP